MELYTSLEPKLYLEFAQALLAQPRVVLIPHLEPDPDAIGSCLALSRWLRSKGRATRVLMPEPVPARAAGMPDTDTIEIVSEISDLSGYAPVIVDTGQLNRIPSGYLKAVEERGGLPLFNFDHHSSNPGFGDHNLVDPTAAACGEMVFNLMLAAGDEPDLPTAELLYGAILTDTGKFSFGNTTHRSLAIAAKLVAQGLRVEEITNYLYNYRTVAQMRLFGEILRTIRSYPEMGLVVGEASLEMYRQTDTSYEDTNGAVELLKTIGDHRLAALLKEQSPGVVKVSLRSKDPEVDANLVLAPLGGGGHPGAAGCTIEGSLEQARRQVLAAIRDYLSRTGKPSP